MPRNTNGLRRGGPGRPKGCPNKVTREIKMIARAVLDDPAYQESVKQRMIDGKAPHLETLYHYYADGKPKDTLVVQDAPPPLVVVVSDKPITD